MRIKKIISILLIITMTVTGESFAYTKTNTSTLAPQSVFDPIFDIKIVDGEVVISEINEDARSIRFKADAENIYYERLKGRLIDLGISEEGIKQYIKEHLEAIKLNNEARQDILNFLVDLRHDVVNRLFNVRLTFNSFQEKVGLSDPLKELMNIVIGILDNTFSKVYEDLELSELQEVRKELGRVSLLLDAWFKKYNAKDEIFKIYSKLPVGYINEEGKNVFYLTPVINLVGAKNLLMGELVEVDDRVKQVNVDELIDGAVLINNFMDKRTTREYDLQNNVCSTDAGALTRALFNLAHNAEDAIRNNKNEGGVLIKTGLSEDKSSMKIIVTDTAGGMSPDILNNIFEPYFSTKTQKEKHSKRGRGLAIAKDCIEKRCGGTIEVKSEHGKGTTFTISLPLEHKDEDRGLGIICKEKADLKAKKIAYEKNLPELQKKLQEEAYDVGGKVLGLDRLKEFSKEIGFETIPTEVLVIKSFFDKYIEANKELIMAGDIILEKKDELIELVNQVVIKHNVKSWDSGIMAEDEDMIQFFMSIDMPDMKELFRDWRICGNGKDVVDIVLMFITNKLTMPEELNDMINAKLKELPEASKYIARTSGRNEDGFYNNLAGEYSSTPFENNAAGTINALFNEFVWINWLTLKKKVLGDGCAIAIEPYMNFDSGFIGFSSLYGITTVETVLGGVEYATGGKLDKLEWMSDERREGSQDFGKENSIVFDFDGDDIDYTRTFYDVPKHMSYKGAKAVWPYEKEFWEKYSHVVTLPDGRTVRSAMTIEELKEVKRVLQKLEEKLGYPVDIEGGFIDGKMYLVQARPVVGLAYEQRTAIPKINNELIGEQCLSLGAIDYTGRLVYKKDERMSQDELDKIKDLGDCIVACREMNILTRAKNVQVVIDMENGSRLAHDTQMVYPYIKKEKRSYVAGLLLKHVLPGLEYIEQDGLKVSKHKVRVISDGIRARVYIVPEEEGHEIPESVSIKVAETYESMWKYVEKEFDIDSKVYKFFLEAQSPAQWEMHAQLNREQGVNEEEYCINFSKLSDKELLDEYNTLDPDEYTTNTLGLSLEDLTHDYFCGHVLPITIAKYNGYTDSLKDYTDLFDGEPELKGSFLKSALQAEKEILLFREWAYRHWDREESKEHASARRVVMENIATLKSLARKNDDEITAEDKEFVQKVNERCGILNDLSIFWDPPQSKTFYDSVNKEFRSKTYTILIQMERIYMESLKYNDLNEFAVTSVEEVATSFFLHEINHLLYFLHYANLSALSIEDSVLKNRANELVAEKNRVTSEMPVWQTILQSNSFVDQSPEMIFATLVLFENYIKDIKKISEQVNEFVVKVSGVSSKEFFGLGDREDIDYVLGESIYALLNFRDLKKRILESEYIFEVDINEGIKKEVEKYNEGIKYIAEVLSEPKGRQVKIDLMLDAKVPIVSANPVRISYIWSNLLGNALDAISERKEQDTDHNGKITIKTGIEKINEKDFVVIEFSDNGNGIPEDMITARSIFDKGKTTKKNGSGLGLYLIDRSIREMGGHIDVTSEIGKGTTFTIKIPITKKTIGFEAKKPSPAIGKVYEVLSARLLGTEDLIEVDVMETTSGEKSTFRLKKNKTRPQQKMNERFEDVINASLKYKDILEQILSLIPQKTKIHTYNSPPEDLFGFASYEGNMAALSVQLIDDPVAVFHEIGEYLLQSGMLEISIADSKMHIVINEEKHIIDVKDVIKELAEEGEKWVLWSENKMNSSDQAHYRLRILQRVLFGYRDRNLTRYISVISELDLEGKRTVGKTWHKIRAIVDAAGKLGKKATRSNIIDETGLTSFSYDDFI
ncbi:MAG: ATP-binding protein, partial [Candidatus Omnitrophica bacterium]|nr:ATP-binding protein [Candidatus Omnitrophota bacterium]